MRGKSKMFLHTISCSPASAAREEILYFSNALFLFPN